MDVAHTQAVPCGAGLQLKQVRGIRDHREKVDLSAVLRTLIGDRRRLLCSVGEDMRIRSNHRLMSLKASWK